MAEASILWQRTSAALRTGAVQNRWVQGAAVAGALFIVYYLTQGEKSVFNQYVLLADSFLHGRLDLVNPPAHLEVGRYADKAFVIDPPAPTLFLMPFVALFGTDINQVLVSMAVGAAAMGLFWVAARQMGWSLQVTAAITLLLGLGTNFWWASADGSLWTFAQVSAVFFLMAALAEATGNKRPWLVGLLVGLAGMSRLPTFLTSPFFAYLIVDPEERPWRELLRDRATWLRLSLFAAGVGLLAAAYFAYNYGRYDSLRDKGYFQPAYDKEPWFAHGRFNLMYIQRHIQGIFFQPPVLTENQFPYFRPSSYGLGLFFTTPAFLYAFNTYLNRRTAAALGATLLTAIPLVFHGTTGWSQFGYRFSMDLFPMLAILTAAGMRHEITSLKWSIIMLSCLIGLWGNLAFHKYHWVV